jgi:hypothetical protein
MRMPWLRLPSSAHTYRLFDFLKSDPSTPPVFTTAKNACLDPAFASGQTDSRGAQRGDYGVPEKRCQIDYRRGSMGPVS